MEKSPSEIAKKTGTGAEGHICFDKAVIQKIKIKK
uniref:Uncharacterized protein n=1 Tax=Rhizophora mucronata TaxID=61149 RepID=A0A2P2JEC5_RHIMU